MYADRGIETHVICLTPGQAASHRGNTRSDEELARLRRQEFQASCEILGVAHGEVLNYRDGALDREPLTSVVADLACHIRQIRPQVMITLGPEGAVTGHPDHSMAGIFATLAFHWAGRTNRFTDQLSEFSPYRAQKLYYGTAMFTLPDRQPVSPPPFTAAIDVSAFWERKIMAFRAHTTQSPLFPIFENNIGKSGKRELFHLAAAITPRQAEMETDLFTSIVDD